MDPTPAQNREGGFTRAVCNGGLSGDESGGGTRLLEAGGPLMWPTHRYPAHPRVLFRDETPSTRFQYHYIPPHSLRPLCLPNFHESIFSS
jgi:hypothetical protein